MSESKSFTDFSDLCRQHPPDVALILGSGLSALTRHVNNQCCLPFSDVPGLAETGVMGHAGRLTLGVWAGKRVLVFEGRLHYYEGHSWSTVVLPAQIARELGARIFLATNAAGGIRADLVPGSMMVLTGHIDWTRPDGTMESNSQIYSPRLNALLEKAAQARSLSLSRGVYAQVTGPCYETPAEIRALRSLGAYAVGMSTVRELVAAQELGMECAGISCIANRAAGLSLGPIHHEDVLTSVTAMTDRLGELLEGFLQSQ
jgi:purine-nucleoside phosphorylase